MSERALARAEDETHDALMPTRCDVCRRSAQVDFVVLEQNIGLILFRIPKRLRAYLCRDCAASAFWRMTLITALLGWWGVISFFVTVAILVRNVRVYLRTRLLPPPA